jgi:carbonic anhydrase/acetyltransferase-like protein (isoleucine patch superfamily)
MRHLAWLFRERESARASGGVGAARLYAHARPGLNRGAPFVAIYEFDGYRPVVHESAFVHPLAAVTGNVVIGRDVYVGPGAAIRGDWGEILIGDGCNVQESCVIHVFPGATVTLHESAHMGHGAIVHGATIGRNTLIGMSAVVMDRAVVGAECIVGALSFVAADAVIPDRKVVVGNPARVVKDVSDEMIAWKTQGTQLYQRLPADMRATWRECEPLREVPADRPKQSVTYRTWNETREN